MEPPEGFFLIYIEASHSEAILRALTQRMTSTSMPANCSNLLFQEPCRPLSMEEKG